MFLTIPSLVAGFGGHKSEAQMEHRKEKSRAPYSDDKPPSATPPGRLLNTSEWVCMCGGQ